MKAPRGRRPLPNGRRKVQIVTFAVTVAQFKQMEDRAAAANQNISEWIRSMLGFDEPERKLEPDAQKQALALLFLPQVFASKEDGFNVR